MDGLGDTVAILGVSLWATILALAPEISGDNLPLVVDTVDSRPWPMGRRANSGGKSEPSDHIQGRSIRTAPFDLRQASGSDLLALKDDVGDREDHDHSGDEPGYLRPYQNETLRGGQGGAK